MNKETRQIFGGATISYIFIIINALYGIVATPYIVSQIGDASFGVYKAITAFASSLMIIDLGLGATVQRYIANFRANDKLGEVGNFISMSLIEALILAVLASIAIFSIYNSLPVLFKGGLTTDEIALAKQLFVVLGVTVILHLFENVMSGVLMGYGEFVVSNGLKLFRIIIRFVCTFLFLYIWKSPLVLVLLDSMLVLFLLLFEFVVIISKLKIKIIFTHFDNNIFKESFIYSIMMFLTALANQMNGNLDNIVIGAFLSSTDVAIYSVAVIVFGMFEQVAGAVSGVLLPKVSFIIKDGLSKIQNYIISIGRIQFMLLGAVYGAFLVLGKRFIDIWMGETYLPAYYIAIILMGPAILELCVNVCLIILRATNKLKYKTVVTIIMTLLNALLTILGVKYYGALMAAIATAISYIIGSVLLMNIYYQREFGFSMINIYKAIFSGTLICVICSSLITYIVLIFVPYSFKGLMIGGFVFVASYVLVLYAYGLTDTERRVVKQLIKI